MSSTPVSATPPQASPRDKPGKRQYMNSGSLKGMAGIARDSEVGWKARGGQLWKEEGSGRGEPGRHLGRACLAPCGVLGTLFVERCVWGMERERC